MHATPHSPALLPTSMRRAAPAESPVASARPPRATPPRVQSQQLLGAAQEVEIDHHGVVYRLRLTALGKLILTK